MCLRLVRTTRPVRVAPRVEDALLNQRAQPAFARAARRVQRIKRCAQEALAPPAPRHRVALRAPTAPRQQPASAQKAMFAPLGHSARRIQVAQTLLQVTVFAQMAYIARLVEILEAAGAAHLEQCVPAGPVRAALPVQIARVVPETAVVQTACTAHRDRYVPAIYAPPFQVVPLASAQTQMLHAPRDLLAAAKVVAVTASTRP